MNCEKPFKENETLELKKTTSEIKEAIISIVAILNKHHEGILYFGIKNDGSVIGQDVGEKTLRDVSKAIADNIEPKIYPEISKLKRSGKDCILVKFSGTETPYYAFGRAYMRVSDEDRQLSAREVENIILKKHRHKIQWERRVSDIELGDIDEKTVKNYIVKANDAGRLDYKFNNLKHVLKKLGLIDGEKLLNAAQILFSDKNTVEFQAAIFSGTDRLNFLDIKSFRGNLFYLLEEAELYIKQHMKWRVKFGKLEREEIPEIPVRAIREALVNSLCHRDYQAPKGNEVAIFKNRIEIYNPGQFPEGLTPEDFISGNERSVPHNPLIADILFFSKDIEKWGSGLKRICDECASNKVKTEFKIIKTGFLVTFYRPETREMKKSKGSALKTIPETIPETIRKTAEQIIEQIIKNPCITTRELAKIIGITEIGIKYNLSGLKAKGVIKRIGPNKGGHWEIIRK